MTLTPYYANISTVTNNTQEIEMNEFESVAKRQANIQDNFVNSVMDQFNKTREEANKVWQVYLAERIVKCDFVTGQYQLSHGIFWESDIIDNAINS